MTNPEILISIIIPVHNEEESLNQLIDELNSVIKKATFNIEVIFINDASTDGTREILEKHCLQYPYIKIINLSKRSGQTGCYQEAFKKAKGRYFIRMDGDLQDDPRDLCQFFPLIEQDVDIIMGLREIRRHKRIFRFASIFYDSLVVLFFDSPLHTNTSSFIAFKAEFMKGLKLKNNDHRHLTLIAMRRGAKKLKEVVVVNRERKFGVSKYDNWKKIVFGTFEVIGVFIRVKLGYYDFMKTSMDEL